MPYSHLGLRSNTFIHILLSKLNKINTTKLSNGAFEYYWPYGRPLHIILIAVFFWVIKYPTKVGFPNLGIPTWEWLSGCNAPTLPSPYHSLWFVSLPIRGFLIRTGSKSGQYTQWFISAPSATRPRVSFRTFGKCYTTVLPRYHSCP